MAGVEARPLPQLSFAVPDQTKRYIVVSLDFDAPYPSAPFLGPVLHWIQPNLVPSPSSGPDATTDADGGGGGGAAGAVVKLESKDAQEGKGFVANYLSPNPPPGSAPHRYGFYLYEQPGGFDAARWAPAAGAKLGHVARVRYSLDDWEREAGLGRVLAANYFTSN